ncbi:MAG TPA: integrase core domain-containing protein [Chloroflexota bacterium]|nr:integrase core domain-containing protein [Chloroflexota bacterium]
MEEEWSTDRARLRCACREHPDWSGARLARELGRSLSWVKKWRRRLAAAPPDDEAVLRSRSRARLRPPPTIPTLTVERVLAIRDDPPAGLQRVPGPRAILYFLEQDPDLRAAGVAPPRSTATVWRVLVQHGRIPRRQPAAHEPLERPPPLTSWQLDFKDVPTVPDDRDGPTGKRQHVVEALNCVDCGTSLLVAAQVRDDFTEETTLAAVAELLQEHGLPAEVTVDRDPRFVGAAQAGAFPSPFVRFLTCLGVAVHINPPRRPDRNAFIERYHGTYESECLRVHRPTTLEEARAVTAAFRRHYNEQRPNQALSCANRPPRVAFPDPPARPPLPAEVDPDAWLRLVDGRRYARTVLAGGDVLVEHARYYVGKRLTGQRVAVAVAAGERALVVRHRGAVVKRLPLRGLHGAPLLFERYLALMEQEARADARRGRARIIRHAA